MKKHPLVNYQILEATLDVLGTYTHPEPMRLKNRGEYWKSEFVLHPIAFAMASVTLLVGVIICPFEKAPLVLIWWLPLALLCAYMAYDGVKMIRVHRYCWMDILEKIKKMEIDFQLGDTRGLSADSTVGSIKRDMVMIAKFIIREEEFRGRRGDELEKYIRCLLSSAKDVFGKRIDGGNGIRTFFDQAQRELVKK